MRKDKKDNIKRIRDVIQPENSLSEESEKVKIKKKKYKTNPEDQLKRLFLVPTFQPTVLTFPSTSQRSTSKQTFVIVVF
jgi:hypothetical protein